MWPKCTDKSHKKDTHVSNKVILHNYPQMPFAIFGSMLQPLCAPNEPSPFDLADAWDLCDHCEIVKGKNELK